MRALILIITCVILLAAMQAAYLVVDAKHHSDKKKVTTDDADQHHKDDHHVALPEEPGTEEPVGKVRKHHKKDLTRDEDKKDKDINRSSIQPSGKKEYNHGTYLSYGKKLRWRKCRQYPELCNKKKPGHRGRKSQGRKDHKDRKGRKDKKKARKNKNKYGSPTSPSNITRNSVQQILELSLDPASQKDVQKSPIQSYEVDPIEATQELYSGKMERNTSTASYYNQNNIPDDDKKEVKEQETSIYDQMIGDAPQTDKDRRKAERKERKDQKKANREERKKGKQQKKEVRQQKKAEKQEKKSDREERKAERQQRKADKVQRKSERQEKKKDKQDKKTGCESDGDCGQGECCIVKRNGKKSCRRGAFKELSKKCESSCMCQEGLQCFVSDTNKRGKKKKVPTATLR